MNLPDHIKIIDSAKEFNFKCSPAVACFNECCRELELALTPYDAMRIRQALKIDSKEFLDNHLVVEFDLSDQLPRVYLGMVDDGRASCPFVTNEGCLVYHDRPAACRSYPIGRGASMSKNKQIDTQYVLVKEPHCLGFKSPDKQTVQEWEVDQDIVEFNRHNDSLMALSQHPKIRRGLRLSEELASLYISTLYDLDSFREKITAGKLDPEIGDEKLRNDILTDDSLLLDFAVKWLGTKLF